MFDREPDLFPELEPPSDGLTNLRARLDADAKAAKRRRLAGYVAAPLAAACLIVLFAFPGDPVPEPVAPSVAVAAPDLRELARVGSHPGLVALGLQDATSDGVFTVPGTDPSTTFRRVETRSDAVLYYVAEPVPAESTPPPR